MQGEIPADGGPGDHVPHPERPDAIQGAPATSLERDWLGFADFLHRDQRHAGKHFGVLELLGELFEGPDQGKRTIWGKDLERAMKQSLTQPQIGDEIAMRRTGADRVTVQRRDRDADGRVISEREVGASRNRWVVEKREFFESRAAAAEVLRDPNVDRRQAVRQHPELVGTYLQLHAAQLAARRIRDPEDREKFVTLVRAALADSVARGEPLQPVRLRDRAGRAPEKTPLEREPGPART